MLADWPGCTPWPELFTVAVLLDAFHPRVHDLLGVSLCLIGVVVIMAG